MKKTVVLVLGLSLVLVGAAIFAYGSITKTPPLVSSANGKTTYVDYVAFFGLAFGGAGVLILFFAFLQWFRKWSSEHGV